MNLLSLSHYFSPGVEAFTAGRDCPLPRAVVQAHQVHQSRVAVVTRQDTPRDELEGIDALVTRTEGCCIGVRTADCVPVLLYDPVARVVAAVHSGWRGTVQRISLEAVGVMCQLGAHACDVEAVIGPSISRQSFQVGEEVADAFARAAFPMDQILSDDGPRGDGMRGGLHIDLWEACRLTLLQAGLLPQHIHVSGLCTYLNSDRFYSARREGNRHDARNINAIIFS